MTGFGNKRAVAFTLIIISICLNHSALAYELTWTGCGISKKAFMAEITKAYEAKTGTRIKLSGGGATKGIRAASANSSDMGGSCRHRVTDSPGEVLKEEANAKLIHVAWDALVAVVHKSNPVNNITLDNLKKVYAGEIISWKDLGSKDKRIILLTRGGQGKYSGVGYMFRLLVFNDPEHDFRARSLIFKSTNTLEKKLEETPRAFGLTGISC